MDSAFVAQISVFGFNFAPKGWAFCDGQLLPLSQNTALFSLLGTNYGGDGKSTFGLPDLQGRAAIGQGQGAGLSEYFIGQTAGSSTSTMINTEIPAHSHTVRVYTGSGTAGATGTASSSASLGTGPSTGSGPHAITTKLYATDVASHPVSLPLALTSGGSSSPRSNMQPYITLNFCIAMQGVFPPRT
ncbi:MAG TPA: tail fiber protein [Mucilaginibacter sp.]|nr:tail fiber protein [Mucilaginibacter sp.]